MLKSKDDTWQVKWLLVFAFDGYNAYFYKHRGMMVDYIELDALRFLGTGTGVKDGDNLVVDFLPKLVVLLDWSLMMSIRTCSIVFLAWYTLAKIGMINDMNSSTDIGYCCHPSGKMRQM